MTDTPGGHWVPLDEASNIRGMLRLLREAGMVT